MNISVIGLGRLGSPWAAVLASKGHTVIGVDLNSRYVDAINAGSPPVYETGLADLIAANRPRLSATSDTRQAVLGTDITFIIVATPSETQGENRGGFSLGQVRSACQAVGDALAHKHGYQLVVLTSTVMPGDTDRVVAPLLQERAASGGRKLGVDFGICYNPEFIALGSVIRDMLTPDMVLIGESDRRAGDLLAEVYRGVCDNRPHVARMNFVNAEITKLAVNTFVTTKISYANMLARLCERLPGGDVDVVTAALGADTRIGRKYLKGAVSYGGPCFPRDNLALQTLATRLGTSASLAEATHQINQQQVRAVLDTVRAELQGAGPAGSHGGRDGRVAILGMSYKPSTDVSEASFGVALAAALAATGVRVTVFDPAAMNSARAVLGDSVGYAASMAEAVGDARMVVIATPWEQFRQLQPGHLQGAGEGTPPVILDCWRVLDPAAFAGRARVVAGGVHS